MDPWPFAVAVLAAYRLTRFLVHDTLLLDARRWLFRRYPPDEQWAAAFGHQRAHKLGQLVDCHYCTGFWMSGLVLAGAIAAGAVETHRPLVVVALWWALAGAQALANTIDARLGR